MTNNTVLDIATRIVDILSTSKTPEIDLPTLLTWIGWDAKAAGSRGDVILARALNLTCDKHDRGGRITYSLKAEHRGN